jgi:hypothetical protein
MVGVKIFVDGTCDAFNDIVNATRAELLNPTIWALARRGQAGAAWCADHDDEVLNTINEVIDEQLRWELSRAVILAFYSRRFMDDADAFNASVCDTDFLAVPFVQATHGMARKLAKACRKRLSVLAGFGEVPDDDNDD